jgi:peptide chain release factor 3
MTLTDHVHAEAARRRTFAIISHPDAGKTTLTEKFLLYGGALQTAGAVKARGGRRSATSDWMEMERERGISITSTVLQFPYRDRVVNLLDTPGHKDFSEDTYRVLAAADAAVMVLDAAKGIEPQTLKLFEVCRAREIPLLTFVNKWDRPGREALDLLDEIERLLDVKATPITWPVGIAGDFRGVVEVATGNYIRYTRTSRDAERAAAEEGAAWTQGRDERELLAATGALHDLDSFLAGITTPVFFGSAITNFGVRPLLDGVIDMAPAPTTRVDADGKPRPLDDELSAFVFKVQANMDRNHRDRIAFLRVCSGHFERGMVVTHGGTGKPFATKYAHSVFGQERETVEEAFPCDVVGLVNATDVRVGDTLYAGPKVTFAGIPSFSPEFFATARALDPARYKQFHRGIAQLDEEGVVQVLRQPDNPEQPPVLAAVGQLQFDVVANRMANEFGAPTELASSRFTLARRTDEASRAKLARMTGVEVMRRSDGLLLALFESKYWLNHLLANQPDLTLEPLVAGALADLMA